MVLPSASPLVVIVIVVAAAANEVRRHRRASIDGYNFIFLLFWFWARPLSHYFWIILTGEIGYSVIWTNNRQNNTEL